jgi:pimeloyl-ACP methyl ester carboxylesterase
MVAVMDAPSDRPKGMNAIFRMERGHAGDIGAVAAHLKQQANVPVWLVGTSMGTFSAAAGAIAGRNIDGLVLSSTITRSKPDWKIAQSHRDGVASMLLPQVTVPALILSHRDDGCGITPAADSPKLAKRLNKARKVDTEILQGGAAPISEPCEARSQHGFFGIEGQAVDAIAKFIAANGK